MKYVAGGIGLLSGVVALFGWFTGLSDLPTLLKGKTKEVVDDGLVSNSVYYNAVKQALWIVREEGKPGMINEIRECYGEITRQSRLDELAFCFTEDSTFHSIDTSMSNNLPQPPDNYFLKEMVDERLKRALILSNKDRSHVFENLVSEWRPQIEAMSISAYQHFQIEANQANPPKTD